MIVFQIPLLDLHQYVYLDIFIYCKAACGKYVLILVINYKYHNLCIVKRNISHLLKKKKKIAKKRNISHQSGFGTHDWI